jgi:hypothetical protein
MWAAQLPDLVALRKTNPAEKRHHRREGTRRPAKRWEIARVLRNTVAEVPWHRTS